MPKSTTCLLFNRVVTVEEALDIRDSKDKAVRKQKLSMICVDCQKPVRPHKAGKTSGAHFEHHQRNPACPLSDKIKNRQKRPSVKSSIQ
ncbi:MAG: hypothetical protein RL014_753 [Pseudomonadota bacterium]